MRINKARNIKSGIKIWVEDSHTLTVAELPAHSHGRGSTNIKGGKTVTIDGGNAESTQQSNSAMIVTVKTVSQKISGGSSGNYTWNDITLTFDASKGWSGTSESKGSGTSIDIMNPYKVAYCFMRVS